MLLELFRVKAVARWQCVESRLASLLFIKAAFTVRLFTQFDTMLRLVMSFFILSKAFKMINQQADADCIVSNSYRQNKGTDVI